MARKIVLDVDPGIDDALAIALALFDPRIEVVAITAVAGAVPAERATRNVQALIGYLDPPRRPRLGAAVEPDAARRLDLLHLHGPDGLGHVPLAVAELHNVHPADKVLADVIRSHPDEITLVCLGPLTNLATVLRREPSLAGLLHRLVVQGGAVDVPGDIAATAEFNLFFDPEAARDVFRSRATLSLVPLDATNPIHFTFADETRLPDESSRAGKLFRQLLPFLLRSSRQHLGLEEARLAGPTALLAAIEPRLFTFHRMACDVETAGHLTRGQAVFDRRRLSEWPKNLEVATELDRVGVREAIDQGLARAAAATTGEER